MAFQPTQYYKDNPRGARMSEGWNRGCTPKEIKFMENTKSGPAILIKWENQIGEVATDFLYESDERSNAKMAQLAEFSGFIWETEMTGEDLAQAFTANLFTMDVEIKWGSGNGAFIQQYAPSNTAKVTPAPKAQPASAGPRQKTTGF